MKNPRIELLEKRLTGLDDKDFDLMVWQGGTALLLNRLFGENNSYSREISDLKVDFSSWSLRDATSNYNPRETAKKRGREILELAIAELQMATSEAGKVATLLPAGVSAELKQAVDARDAGSVRATLKKEKKKELIELLVQILVN